MTTTSAELPSASSSGYLVVPSATASAWMKNLRPNHSATVFSLTSISAYSTFPKVCFVPVVSATPVAYSVLPSALKEVKL